MNIGPSTTCLNAICVFSGSAIGAKPEYAQAAVALGEELVERGIGLVYGGARVGLMGVVADSVLKGGGHVTGVIPDFLAEKELAHRDLDDLRIVHSMHERKALMAELSDGFIALPGGFGTFEELFEVLTWSQLGLHEKPVGVLDVDGYYKLLFEFLDQSVDQRFVKATQRDAVLRSDDPGALIDLFATFAPPTGGKWFDGEVI